MTIKKAIAIGGLSILAFTLTLFGINHNLFKTKKPQESKASGYISDIVRNQDNSITYELHGSTQANYTNPNADNYYKFNYNYDLTINSNLPVATITGTITITHIFTTNTAETLNEAKPINLTYTGTQANKVSIQSIEIAQENFSIEENYYLTTQIAIKFTYLKGRNTFTNTTYYTFEPTLNNYYENINSEYIVQAENYDISANLGTIFDYANAQYEEGYNEGYEIGLATITEQDAYQQGKTDGYAEGYNNSEAFNHPIAIQPLMLNILSMPFTFLSKAFDVTLWPNTPYEFNIGNFIKAMIAIAAIIFIIKLFTSGFSVMGNFTGKINSNLRSNKPSKTTTKTNTPKKE